MFTKYLIAMVIGLALAQDQYPEITIRENGEDKKVYIVQNSGTTPKGGDTLNVAWGQRAYLANNASLGEDNFYGVNLLGGSISYDVNLSAAGCSCNHAFYLVSMPGRDVNGKPSTGDFDDYYCDANKVGGQWCPEFDLMEADTFAWHSTPHKCDPANSKGHYFNCDRGGSCFQKALDINATAYGPNSTYTIDTSKPFSVQISFKLDAHFQVELTQGNNSISMASDESCTDYLTYM